MSRSFVGSKEEAPLSVLIRLTRERGPLLFSDSPALSMQGKLFRFCSINRLCTFDAGRRLLALLHRCTFRA